MGRNLAEVHRWADLGTELFLRAAELDEDAFREPSSLPGWSRKHLIAHVAANADALGNLVHWAATGEPTPMYSSREQRGADIESGSLLPADDLVSWVRRSSSSLGAAMQRLTPQQWEVEVMTAQGRAVPATSVPWLRAREVFVHAVDLNTGVGFRDLPPDFLTALCDDVVDQRGSTAGDQALELVSTDSGGRWQLPGAGPIVVVRGALGDLSAYVTGRHHDLTTIDDDPAPELGPWL